MPSLTRLLRRVSAWDTRDKPESQQDKTNAPSTVKQSTVPLPTPRRSRPSRNARLNIYTNNSDPLEHDLFCQTTMYSIPPRLSNNLDDAFIQDVFTRFRTSLPPIAAALVPRHSGPEPEEGGSPNVDTQKELEEAEGDPGLETSESDSATSDDFETEAVTPYVSDSSAAQSPRGSVDMSLQLPSEVWHMIASYLPSESAASLALTSRTMRLYLGTTYWQRLSSEDNRAKRATFLEHMDDQLPDHVLCYRCAKYHYRRNREREHWTQEYHHACPISEIGTGPQMTKYRVFPTELYQLTMRAHFYGVNFGIPLSALNRRWTSESSESGWRHHSRCAILDNHLFVKVQSIHWVEAKMSPSELRIVIAERYGERFAHCKHIGQTFDRFCRCAVRHVRVSGIRASDCADCRPLRRCAQCPTEYLVEIKLLEDRNALDPLTRFRHALVVSRWSDLGNGSVASPEWLACNSAGDDQPRWTTSGWNSARQRTIRSKFEAHLGRRVPEVPALELREWRTWTKKSQGLLGQSNPTDSQTQDDW